MKPVLAVSMGDPAGIGPEIVAAAATVAGVRRACRMVVFGDPGVLEEAARRRGIASTTPSAIDSVVAVGRLPTACPQPGRPAGKAAFRYLEAAAAEVLAGRFDGLVTAPINKLWMNRAGHVYDGHTGYLSELCGRPATMMLAGRRLRVVLVTTHMALAEVPSAITVAAICRAARTTAAHLSSYHGIDHPRLAVAALNPHAGEGGIFGAEEKTVIKPAVARLRRGGLAVEGPLAADTLFAAAASGHYDAVVCMYHDQALIPLKLLEFGHSVNISMGLPFIRTSPDHGTAYELTGTGQARKESMVEAILLASRMARGGEKRGRE